MAKKYRDVASGLALSCLGDPSKLEKAKVEVLSLLEKKGDDDGLLYMLGHIYYIERRFADAAECFRKCVSLRKGVREYYLALAFAYRHLGKYRESDDLIFWLTGL